MKLNKLKSRLLILMLFYNFSSLTAQTKPKLIIGLVVDQMRWDYLYHFKSRYSKNGFQKLLNNGFSQEQTFIPYTPTVTAIGHSCVYTGSVPAVSGMVGNAWYHRQLQRNMYCVEDSTVQSVGGDPKNGKMSPKNLLTTTITDELRLSNNFKSKTVGIAIKDRGSILPAGHSANAAYWYDGKTGNWITSSYYTNQLPTWVQNFNNRKVVDSFYAMNWNTFYAPSSYKLSTQDERPYEGKMKGSKNTSFPHQLTSYIGKDYDVIAGTPYGNTLTLMLAKEAINNMQLGKTPDVTDFLAISLSSPDYIGHRNGPNSIEIEDNYIRLDRDIADLLTFLEQKLGANNFTLFLTADHGVAHVPGFLKENKIPAGVWDNEQLAKDIKLKLKQQFGSEFIWGGESNYQVYLNNDEINRLGHSKEKVINYIIDYLQKQPGIAQVFVLEKLTSTTIQPLIKERLTNGYHAKRSGDIQILLEPAWIDGNGTGTTHGLWNPYDSHIPMVWYGWGINKGKSNQTRYMTDIAPTLAALLQIQMPNGSVGQVMTEVLK